MFPVKKKYIKDLELFLTKILFPFGPFNNWIYAPADPIYKAGTLYVEHGMINLGVTGFANDKAYLPARWFVNQQDTLVVRVVGRTRTTFTREDLDSDQYDEIQTISYTDTVDEFKTFHGWQESQSFGCAVKYASASMVNPTKGLKGIIASNRFVGTAATIYAIPTGTLMGLMTQLDIAAIQATSAQTPEYDANGNFIHKTGVNTVDVTVNRKIYGGVYRGNALGYGIYKDGISTAFNPPSNTSFYQRWLPEKTYYEGIQIYFPSDPRGVYKYYKGEPPPCVKKNSTESDENQLIRCNKEREAWLAAHKTCVSGEIDPWPLPRTATGSDGKPLVIQDGTCKWIYSGEMPGKYCDPEIIYRKTASLYLGPGEYSGKARLWIQAAFGCKDVQVRIMDGLLQIGKIQDNRAFILVNNNYNSYSIYTSNKNRHYLFRFLAGSCSIMFMEPTLPAEAVRRRSIGLEGDKLAEYEAFVLAYSLPTEWSGKCNGANAFNRAYQFGSPFYWGLHTNWKGDKLVGTFFSFDSYYEGTWESQLFEGGVDCDEDALDEIHKQWELEKYRWADYLIWKKNADKALLTNPNYPIPIAPILEYFYSKEQYDIDNKGKPSPPVYKPYKPLFYEDVAKTFTVYCDNGKYRSRWKPQFQDRIFFWDPYEGKYYWAQPGTIHVPARGGGIVYAFYDKYGGLQEFFYNQTIPTTAPEVTTNTSEYDCGEGAVMTCETTKDDRYNSDFSGGGGSASGENATLGINYSYAGTVSSGEQFPKNGGWYRSSYYSLIGTICEGALNKCPDGTQCLGDDGLPNYWHRDFYANVLGMTTTQSGNKSTGLIFIIPRTDCDSIFLGSRAQTSLNGSVTFTSVKTIVEREVAPYCGLFYAPCVRRDEKKCSATGEQICGPNRCDPCSFIDGGPPVNQDDWIIWGPSFTSFGGQCTTDDCIYRINYPCGPCEEGNSVRVKYIPMTANSVPFGESLGQPNDQWTKHIEDVHLANEYVDITMVNGLGAIKVGTRGKNNDFGLSDGCENDGPPSTNIGPGEDTQLAGSFTKFFDRIDIIYPWTNGYAFIYQSAVKRYSFYTGIEKTEYQCDGYPKEGFVFTGAV